MPERNGTPDAEVPASKRQRRSKWGPEEGGPPADDGAQSSAIAVFEASQPLPPTYAILQQQQLGALRQPDQLMQVYVGNLDPFIGEQEILQIFSAFGTVVSIDMPKEGSPPRSRGYCFVEYLDLAMADKAIASLQDFTLGGQKLKVGRSTKKRTASGVLPTITYAGAGQSLLASGHTLAAATAPGAAAAEASPSAPNGAGGGKTSLETVMATTAAAGGDTGKLMERRKAVVTGIPREFATKEVATVFQAFGMVRSCVLLPSTTQPELHCGTAIIEFATDTSAKEAVKTMNGFALAGSTISLVPGSTVPIVSAGAVEPAPSMKSVRTAADLAREAGWAAGAHQPGLPSRVLLLENLVGAGEADGELAEEVSEECSHFGDVNKVTVYECRKEPGVRVFVRFEEEESGAKAAQALNGRWFGGRQVRASTYGEERYLSGDFDSAAV
uniref:RRM domain-containing protein n=1 Tax=Alexandrium catenella TaxID=2925 RepID=A0A7S1L869_ALECA|mmetsp:Transcript_10828/g.29461  ORF Transcript_10828/g.29461 Transcript_10828/m.29461 type:complete len:442 (+) Transcript_10828:3-1328(+)